MKIGIMQPYYFPYIGYWQLMNAVDKYVIYDDVNFIKGGWINRNRVLNNGSASFFNVKMSNASPNLFINEIGAPNDLIYKNKQIRTLEMLYKKAPYYNECIDTIKSIIMCEEENLALYLKNGIMQIAHLLDMKTEFYLASEIDYSREKDAQDKVIDIVNILGGNVYYNAEGGKCLYDMKVFASESIELKFLQAILPIYEQFGAEFVQGLSIIDVLMFNGIEKTKKLLHDFTVA